MKRQIKSDNVSAVQLDKQNTLHIVVEKQIKHIQRKIAQTAIFKLGET